MSENEFDFSKLFGDSQAPAENDFLETARGFYEIYSALKTVGFSSEETLYLLKAMLEASAANLRGGA